MCITFLFINPDPNGKYRLILLNNRDEFLERPTAELEWRDGLLGGLDLLDPAKGTWLAMNENGKIGNLLSITQPAAMKRSDAPSRGAIPHDLLRSAESSTEFCEKLVPRSTNYNGFQFVALDRNEHGLYNLQTVTNLFVDEINVKQWTAGVHCIGNSPPHTPYKKVIYGKERMTKAMEQITDKTSIEEIKELLMDIAHDRTKNHPDPQYSLQFQRGPEFTESLSAIFVRFPDEFPFKYGTRSHSIIVVDKDDNVTYYEKRMSELNKEAVDNSKWTEKTVEFKLKNNKL